MKCLKVEDTKIYISDIYCEQISIFGLNLHYVYFNLSLEYLKVNFYDSSLYFFSFCLNVFKHKGNTMSILTISNFFSCLFEINT